MLPPMTTRGMTKKAPRNLRRFAELLDPECACIGVSGFPYVGFFQPGHLTASTTALLSTAALAPIRVG